jgi:DNA-binding transcriptional ArsR family regulator
MPDVREVPDVLAVEDVPPLTTSLDYELEPMVRADTPVHLKALADPTRVTILDLVLERAATTTELADALGKPRGTVDHHLKVLEKAGLMRVVRTRKVRAMTERFWGRTARTIMIGTPAGEAGEEIDRGAYFVRQALEEIRATPHDLFHDGPGLSTLRHARIPAERMAAFVERLEALALEFVSEPRGGDVVYGLLLNVFPTARPGLRAPT